MYRLCVLGYLNGWIGEGMRAGITGTFGVPEENDNGKKKSGEVVLKGGSRVCLSIQGWQGVNTEWR